MRQSRARRQAIPRGAPPAASASPAQAAPPAQSLTPRQREVLNFIRRHGADRGFPPTIAEIAEHFEMRSGNAAAQHLRLIAQKGAIEIAPGVSRGIRVVEAEARRERKDRARSLNIIKQKQILPIVGRVAAGSPILAEENLEGELAIDPGAFRPRAHYLLRVVGDSMIGAGIFDGDLVAVHRRPDVHHHEIAVVRVGGGASGEVTVKRVRRSGSQLTLIPDNPRLRPTPIDLQKESVTIEGVVVGLVRTRAAGMNK